MAALLIWSTFPAWAGTLLEIEKLSADPARAKEALARLAQLPLAECQSVEYQLALARAGRNANAPAPVAEAVATAELVPSRAAPGEYLPPGFSEHRKWLAQTGDQLYAKAMSALDAGDRKTAVKAYLVSVKCAAELMARDDRGLRDLAIGALRRMADAHPEKPALRFQLGYYSWLFGDLPAATAALERYEAEEKDPYRRWRGQLWRQRVTAEHQRALADERAAAAAAARARAADPGAHSADLPNTGGAVDRDAAAREDVRRNELRKQIEAIEAEMADLESKTRGEVHTKNGQLVVRTHNHKEIRARLDALSARKAELQAQL